MTRPPAPTATTSWSTPAPVGRTRTSSLLVGAVAVRGNARAAATTQRDSVAVTGHRSALTVEQLSWPPHQRPSVHLGHPPPRRCPEGGAGGGTDRRVRGCTGRADALCAVRPDDASTGGGCWLRCAPRSCPHRDAGLTSPFPHRALMRPGQQLDCVSQVAVPRDCTVVITIEANNPGQHVSVAGAALGPEVECRSGNALPTVG